MWRIPKRMKRILFGAYCGSCGILLFANKVAWTIDVIYHSLQFILTVRNKKTNNYYMNALKLSLVLEFHFKTRREVFVSGLFCIHLIFFSKLIGNSMYPAIQSNDKALIEYLTVSNYRVQK